MKRYNGIKKSDILFIILQIILYVTFLTLDLNEGSVTLSKWIKYSIIILCFCYALFFGKGVDKGIIFCIKTALLFTLISDLFILILDYYIYGVLTFIVAQQLYAFRISLTEEKISSTLGSKKRLKTLSGLGRGQELGWITKAGRIPESKELLLGRFLKWVLLQVLITAVICFLLMRFDVKLEVLLITSVFYFVCIVTNVLRSFLASVHNRDDRSIVLFSVGMGLFLLCDINVGLFNLSGFINLHEDIYHNIYSISSILMWTFYAPSQVLIALSAAQKSKN